MRAAAAAARRHARQHGAAAAPCSFSIQLSEPPSHPVVAAVLGQVEDRHRGVAEPAEREMGRRSTEWRSARRREASSAASLPAPSQQHDCLSAASTSSLVHQRRLEQALHVVEGPVGECQGLHRALLGRPVSRGRGVKVVGSGRGRSVGEASCRAGGGGVRGHASEPSPWLAGSKQGHCTCRSPLPAMPPSAAMPRSVPPSPAHSLDAGVKEGGQEVEERVDEQRAQVLPEEDGGVADLRGEDERLLLWAGRQQARGRAALHVPPLALSASPPLLPPPPSTHTNQHPPVAPTSTHVPAGPDP